MQENYYYGQGKVFLAPRDNKRAFRWVGDVSSLKIAFSYEQQVTKASRGGMLYQDKRIITGASGSLSSTWHNFSAENLALLLGARIVDEPFAIDGEFSLPEGIVRGDVIALPHTTVFNVSIDGLSKESDYVVDRQWGTIEFLITPSSQKLVVRYEYLLNQSLPFFSTGEQELHLRYQGVNLAEGFSPVLLELYRLSVDPLATLEMITNENNLGGLEMTSIILPDFNQKTNTAFSYFGRLQAVTPYPTLTYNGQASYDGKYRYRGK
ncbi:phage tail tube protein [Serratia marcescens]